MTEELGCPYCADGSTIRKEKLYEDDTDVLYIENEDGKERVYLEDDYKKVCLKSFYFCPFCGRTLKGRRLKLRKFRGK